MQIKVYTTSKSNLSQATYHQKEQTMINFSSKLNQKQDINKLKTGTYGSKLKPDKLIAEDDRIIRRGQEAHTIYL